MLLEKGFAESRQRAQAIIMSGSVLVDNTPSDKPGSVHPASADIKLKTEDHPFVSRGGLKLEAALKDFDFHTKGLVCIDVGASTGGFTDCLLQQGAKHVYAVDVGYGQLSWKLRNDPRVTAIERTNIRYMPQDALPEKVDLATIDASFISLKIVVPSVLKFLKDSSSIIALIKPQFEVGKEKVPKGGVVKDPRLHDEVINNLASFFNDNDLEVVSTTTSPILGPKGNKEFFVLLNY